MAKNMYLIAVIILDLWLNTHKMNTHKTYINSLKLHILSATNNTEIAVRLSVILGQLILLIVHNESPSDVKL